MNLVDYFGGTFIIVFLASFEVIAISWIYGKFLFFNLFRMITKLILFLISQESIIFWTILNSWWAADLRFIGDSAGAS